jgi:hypothetical protein
MEYIESRTWSNQSLNPLGHANPVHLSEAYWQGSARSVAKKYGVTPDAITSFLASHNMLRRPPYDPKLFGVPPELIQKLYWTQGKTCQEIASIFSVHSETVRNFMKHHRIPRRNVGSPRKEVAANQDSPATSCRAIPLTSSDRHA